MAQLVARFHGMEEVGGSNPPSSTKNSDTQLVSVGFLLSLDGSFVCCAGNRWPFMARVVHPLVGRPLLMCSVWNCVVIMGSSELSVGDRVVVSRIVV